MVILNKQIDGLGNQLLLTAHFIANAAAYGYELAIPNFDAYKNLFEGTAGPAPGAAEAAEVRLNLAPQVGGLGLLSRLLQRRWTLPLLQRLPGGVHLAGWHIMGDDDEAGHDLNAPAFVAEAGAGQVLVHGWLYRDKPHFAEYGGLLRRLFRVVEPHRQAVTQVLATNRANADVLVGVHIRRGDYDNFLGGAYFFANATYARVMRDMQALFLPGTRVRFLLCSNEPIPAADFAEFDTGRSTDQFVEDLYALAGCDYLIGPLSTYSMWASFYGEVPLLHLHHPNQSIQALDEFTVFEDQPSMSWSQEIA